MAQRNFLPGDWVIYHKAMFSQHPGPRAREIDPAPLGELYAYAVDKYWTVEEIHNDGTIKVRTRRGKSLVLAANDINLHRATWWERLWYRSRFPSFARVAI